METLEAESALDGNTWLMDMAACLRLLAQVLSTDPTWESVDLFCPCPIGDEMLVVDISNDAGEQSPKQTMLEPGDTRL